MSLAHRQAVNLESTGSTVLTSQENDPTTTIVLDAANADEEQAGQSAQQDAENAAQEKWKNKYIYPEFTGPGGRRYLVEILTAILPSALLLTWEAADSCGPECYAGIDEVADRRSREDRTLERNIRAMESRQLLRRIPTCRPFRMPDGSFKMRPVKVWDFSGLLALAHEYHLWLHSDEYIPPERERMAEILENELLCAKLLRFEIYRRRFCTEKRGRKPSYSPYDELFSQYDVGQDGQEMPKIQNSTLLSKTLSKILSSESTNSSGNLNSKGNSYSSKAEKGTDSRATAIRHIGNISEKQQVRFSTPPSGEQPAESEITPKVQDQGNGPAAATAKRAIGDVKAEKKLSTAEKVAAVTGIVVEHQLRPGSKQKKVDGPRLPGDLAQALAAVSEAFHDEHPASSQTDMAKLYLRARAASDEQLTSKEFWAKCVARAATRAAKLLEDGEITTVRKDDDNIPNAMPLFMRWVRMTVEKLEKEAGKRRARANDVAYLAMRHRQTQAQTQVSEAPAPVSVPMPETPPPASAQELMDEKMSQPSASVPSPDASQADEDAQIAQLQAELSHPHAGIRRAAARRLYAYQQLPRLRVLGVSSPIVFPHHCFSYHLYVPEPGVEPRCVSCDPDPTWPAEVKQIVEDTKRFGKQS